MMGLTLKTSMSAVDAFLLKAANYIMDCIKAELAVLAQECDERVRKRSAAESWVNRSGNLRSSIGAAVYDRGVLYMETAFDTVLDGSSGSAEGRQMVREMADQYKDVVAMTVIAAKDYASNVEALENKDVLESTRIWALQEVEARLDKAKDKAIKEINTWKV